VKFLKVSQALVFIGAFGLAGFAHASLNSTVEDDSQGLNNGAPLYKNPFLVDQLHVAKRSAAIQVEQAFDDDGSEIQELTGQFIDVAAGSLLSVTDESSDGRFVTLSFDLEGMMAEGKDVSELPNLVKVNAFELSKLDLSMVTETAMGDGTGEIIIPEFLAGKGKGRAKMTYCLRDVRVFASGKNCRAKIARVSLARQGYAAYLATGDWKKISKKDWKSYPVCTACFYAGGRQDCSGGCGHTAIKINSNQWKGAGIRTVPGLPDHNGYHKGVLRRPYKFLGCIVPKRVK